MREKIMNMNIWWNPRELLDFIPCTSSGCLASRIQLFFRCENKRKCWLLWRWQSISIGKSNKFRPICFVQKMKETTFYIRCGLMFGLHWLASLRWWNDRLNWRMPQQAESATNKRWIEYTLTQITQYDDEAAEAEMLLFTLPAQ